ncbi:RtcB family protein [Amycolatopsis magusensis]|uniref:3'-phosphate/5'-hydroxy nucleic acid ligase n=1 Tax=Amycolatopsis magusensis TaxID=882444 RepID=A0ABS4PKG6_9PSEU|nr:RtcB family protein [Amycolatopsis magusensis]MBP2179334.1 tRNA-splicing ligase RtcB [Amycolatopsis magusensis]MDI5978393.1 RtcB family protein [Amycolatopsis magusensis]
MYTAVDGARVPIRMWADPRSVEEQAMRQLHNVANLPWVHGVAVMPDVHYGKGATVGSVIAMRDAVSPAAVGVDIGCGMSAVRTSLTAADLPDDLGKLRRRIESAVPVGFGMHRNPVNPARVHGVGGWSEFWNRFGELHAGVQDLRERAHRQVGSLGGGNHFIEVCLEQGGADEGRVWLMLHSGSRNIGKELAERHMGVARKLPHNADLPDRDLAVFVAGTPEMQAYRRDLFWAQDYAARNRATMVALVKQALKDEVPQTTFDDAISCHHNYVSEETYDGVELLVTRKGAIRAGSGDLGIIPGSMGTGSYIVRGLGNADSFQSASHGAGRRMSRTKAKKLYTAADLAAQTDGVECRKDSGVVDEIPAAYKDIDSVIAAQSDLVEVVAHLKQVVCVKG